MFLENPIGFTIYSTTLLRIASLLQIKLWFILFLWPNYWFVHIQIICPLAPEVAVTILIK